MEQRVFEGFNVALFETVPAMGEFNPKGEVHYDGYERQHIVDMGGISFPKSKGTDEIYVQAIVIMNGNNQVRNFTVTSFRTRSIESILFEVFDNSYFCE